MQRVISINKIKDLVGTELGVSKWMDVPQSRIDVFADATDDHQFIHVDPERAAETPFGGTIAHGFLTLSMLSAMHTDAVPRVEEDHFGINYGFNKIRFMAPVPVDGRIRGRFFLKEARLRGAKQNDDHLRGEHRNRGWTETGDDGHLADHHPVRPE